ncbi:MAG: hypothetical protein IIA90_01830 [Chloroflexi bacterium]|nr:hypothetical protein [Chloroflexota bacterium]
MKTSTALWLGLIAVIVLTLAACGGDDDDGASGPNGASPATEAAYLEALAPALQAVNAQLEGLGELRAAAFDDGPDPAAADAYGAAYETFALERLAAIEALTPNESLIGEHQALLSAASDGVVLAEDLRAKLGESPPASEVEFLALFGDLDGATITSRFHDACTALQSDATSGGLDIDLQCLL